MSHLTSCSLLLLGLILQIPLCGSSGIVSRMLLGQQSIYHPNCLQHHANHNLKYKCPPGEHVHGQVCQITCVEGYHLTGSPASITCLDGHWTFSSAKCVVSACPSPQLVSHGVYHCTSKTHDIGAVCNLICDKGYQPESPKTITCQSSATWSFASTCVQSACPSPQLVSHGVYHCTSKTHDIGAVCNLICDQGYQPESTKTITCQSSATWSFASACVPMCPVPSTRNGHVSCTFHGRHIYMKQYKVGSVCTASCTQGFTAIHPRFSCVSDIHGGAKWSAQPSCKETRCPQPPHPSHGVYYCQSPTHQIHAVCSLVCDDGYRPKSSITSITCQSSAIWSAPSSCVPTACPAPPKLLNGVYSCTSRHGSQTHKTNDMCQLHCNQGYRPSTTHSDITCLSTGVWSASSGCQATTCPAPPHIAHGRYHCKVTHGLITHKLNDVCQLHCKEGYRPSSSHSDITCLSTGRWSAPATCSVVCPAVPKVTNGWYFCHSSHGSGTHRLNEVCHLHCYKAYRPSTTDSDIKCLSTGLWSTQALCHEIKCPAPPNVANGKYTCASSTTHKLNDTCHLQCSAGYKPNNPGSNITCLYSEQWSTPNSCIEITCSALPIVTNGKYACATSAPHKLNDVCELQCSHGYKPNSQYSDIKCLDSEKWSSSTACKEIKCPVLPKVQNGHYSCSPSSVQRLNDVCHLQCASGYKPTTPHSDITCQANETWSSPVSCKEIRCPPPPKVLNGQYNCSSSSIHKLNDVCHLHCVSGYKPSTIHSDITCKSSDSWSTPASCIEIKCPVPPKVLNGQYNCSSSSIHKLKDVCHLHCANGYKPNTMHSDITCMSFGSWSTHASCKEIRCPSPPTVSHGQYRCPSIATHKLNDTCHLECSDGYKPREKGSHISCLSSNEWSTSDSCIEIQCPAPPNVIHGQYTCASSTNHTLNNVCHLQCSAGYKPNNPGSNIACLSSEKWSSPDSCTEKTCSQPPTVANGKYECSSHRVDHDCRLQCSAGYKPNNPESNITCLSSAKWSSPDSCTEKTCSLPPTVANGKYECSSHRVDHDCQLNCLYGYQQSRIDSNITCLSTEKWSTTSATCKEIQCPSPATVSHGSFHCSSTVHKPGSTCSLTCDTGYTPSRSNTEIVCSFSSTWSSSPTCDEIQCPSPATVSHGSFNCSSSVHKPGSTCSLTCDTGYTPSRAKTEIVCSSSSSWSSPPTCDQKYCQVPPTVSHGSFHCSSTVHTPGSTCTLTCDSGYIPSRSDTVIVCSSLSTWSSSARCDAVSTTISSTSTTSASTTTIVTTSSTSMTTQSATSMSTSTVSPTTIAPLGCEVCSGSLCGLIPGNDPVIQCPNIKPYCLNHVDNDSTGSKTVTKSCADADECNRRWWHETSDKSNCVDFNPTNIYTYQLSCTYCCTKPGCNKDIVPARHTLFIGHD